MCGRFTQIKTRDDYLEELASDLEFAGGRDTVPLERYNVAPGTGVLLNQRSTLTQLSGVMGRIGGVI